MSTNAPKQPLNEDVNRNHNDGVNSTRGLNPPAQVQPPPPPPPPPPKKIFCKVLVVGLG